jgi:hypothetical protein
MDHLLLFSWKCCVEMTDGAQEKKLALVPRALNSDEIYQIRLKLLFTSLMLKNVTSLVLLCNRFLCRVDEHLLRDHLKGQFNVDIVLRTSMGQC